MGLHENLAVCQTPCVHLNVECGAVFCCKRTGKTIIEMGKEGACEFFNGTPVPRGNPIHPRPPVTAGQVASFAVAGIFGRYVTDEVREEREKICAGCDQVKHDETGKPWCGVCGCGVSSEERKIRNLAAYEEWLPHYGCKHPQRAEGKGWPIAEPKKLKVHTSPNGTRFAFVRVPKAAGESVTDRLGIEIDSHIPLSSLTEEELTGPLVTGTFTFAVVRNPWDRLLSAFHYLLQGGKSDTNDAQDRKTLLPWVDDFPGFVRAFAAEPEKFFKLQHLRPQIDWMKGRDGKISTTKICRLENLTEDVEAVCAHLGIEPHPLPARNRSAHPTVDEAYDHETAAMVGKIYADDIEAFGYKPPRPHPPRNERPVWTHKHATDAPAIVTASDETFFPGMRTLALSVRRQNPDVPVICVDIGMTPAQRREAAGFGVMVTPRTPTPIDPYLHLVNDPLCRAWYGKPWYFDAAGPHRAVVWMDSDIVALRDLDKLLAMVGQRPVFCRNTGGASSTCRNADELYDRFPVPGPIYPGGVNAGLVGVNLGRDAGIMHTWRGMVQRAVADFGTDLQPGAGKLARWGDQGMLLWTIHKLRMIDLILDEGMKWNYPAQGFGRKRPRDPSEYPHDDPDKAIAMMLADYPDAANVHFLGRPKYFAV